MMIQIDENKLKIAIEEAQDEFKNTKVDFLNFGENSLRELPLIRAGNLKYYLNHLIIDKSIVEGFINDISKKIEEDTKSECAADHIIKLMKSYNAHKFVFSISKEI